MKSFFYYSNFLLLDLLRWLPPPFFVKVMDTVFFLPSFIKAKWCLTAGDNGLVMKSYNEETKKMQKWIKLFQGGKKLLNYCFYWASSDMKIVFFAFLTGHFSIFLMMEDILLFILSRGKNVVGKRLYLSHKLPANVYTCR